MGTYSMSKSKYCKGVQCPKMLWMDRNMPEMAVEMTPDAVFQTGTEVGILAREYFPDCQTVSFSYSKEEMCRQTRELLASGCKVIAEASFLYGNNFCSVDILRLVGEEVQLIEVKSATEVHDVFLIDMAYQYYVLRNCGLNVTTVINMHVNNEYVRGEELELDKLFVMEDCTETILQLQAEIADKIEVLTACAEAEEEPHRELGIYCEKPYECVYKTYCHREIKQPSIFSVARLSTKKKYEFYSQGIVSFEDIVKEEPMLNEKQWRQVNSYVYQEAPFIDKDAINGFLDALTYPLYYLDFETFQQIIPQYKGVKPYMQIPFQYSLHIQMTAGAPPEHYEFLGKEGTDPRRALAEQLCKHIPRGVCVLAYNMAFEKTIIKDLAEFYVDLSEHLMDIYENIRDLMFPFQNQYFYCKELEGSYSIKKVLPVLCGGDRELDYNSLDEIHNGSEAMNAFADLPNQSADRIERTRQNLLAYCRLDTLAMVKIVEQLKWMCEGDIQPEEKYLKYEEMEDKQMTDEQKKARKESVESGKIGELKKNYLRTKDGNEDYVFISYKSDYYKEVLEEIVYRACKKYGLRVYFDTAFDDKTALWTEQLTENIQNPRCKAFIAFLNNEYYGSYATLLEMMTANTYRAGGKLGKGSLFFLPINLSLITAEESEKNTGLGTALFSDKSENRHAKEELHKFNSVFKEVASDKMKRVYQREDDTGLYYEKTESKPAEGKIYLKVYECHRLMELMLDKMNSCNDNDGTNKDFVEVIHDKLINAGIHSVFGEIKENTSLGTSGTNDKTILNKEYWREFVEYAFNESDNHEFLAANFNKPTIADYTWCGLPLGSAKVSIELSFSTQKKQIRTAMLIKDEKLFEDLKQIVATTDLRNRVVINADSKTKNIHILQTGVDIIGDRIAQFEWFMKYACVFREIADRALNSQKTERCSERTSGTNDKVKLNKEYWREFVEYAFDKSDNHEFLAANFNKPTIADYTWCGLPLGSAKVSIELSFSTQKKQIRTAMLIKDEELFKDLKQIVATTDLRNSVVINADSKTKNIHILQTGVDIAGDRITQFEWFMKYACVFKEIADNALKQK